MKIGIVGNGFVGEAMAFAFSTSTEIRIYDKIKDKSTHSLQKIYECDFVFVCFAVLPGNLGVCFTRPMLCLNYVMAKGRLAFYRPCAMLCHAEPSTSCSDLLCYAMRCFDIHPNTTTIIATEMQCNSMQPRWMGSNAMCCFAC